MTVVLLLALAGVAATFWLAWALWRADRKAEYEPKPKFCDACGEQYRSDYPITEALEIHARKCAGWKP